METVRSIIDGALLCAILVGGMFSAILEMWILRCFPPEGRVNALFVQPELQEATNATWRTENWPRSAGRPVFCLGRTFIPKPPTHHNDTKTSSEIHAHHVQTAAKSNGNLLCSCSQRSERNVKRTVTWNVIRRGQGRPFDTWDEQVDNFFH